MARGVRVLKDDLAALTSDGVNYVGGPSDSGPGCTIHEPASELADQRNFRSGALERGHSCLVRFVCCLCYLEQRYGRTVGRRHEVGLVRWDAVPNRDRKRENAKRDCCLKEVNSDVPLFLFLGAPSRSSPWADRQAYQLRNSVEIFEASDLSRGGRPLGRLVLILSHCITVQSSPTTFALHPLSAAGPPYARGSCALRLAAAHAPPQSTRQC